MHWWTWSQKSRLTWSEKSRQVVKDSFGRVKGGLQDPYSLELCRSHPKETRGPGCLFRRKHYLLDIHEPVTPWTRTEVLAFIIQINRTLRTLNTQLAQLSGSLQTKMKQQSWGSTTEHCRNSSGMIPTSGPLPLAFQVVPNYNSNHICKHKTFPVTTIGIFNTFMNNLYFLSRNNTMQTISGVNLDSGLTSKVFR